MFCAISGNFVKKSGDVMAGDLDMGPYSLKFIDGSQSGAIRTADGYANRLAFRKYDDSDRGSFLVYEGKFDGDINMSGLKTVDGVDVSEDLLRKTGGEMSGNITFAGAQTVDGVDVSAIVQLKVGTRVSRANDTVYQAATDGFVSAGGTPAAPFEVKVFSDANNPPTVELTRNSNSANPAGGAGQIIKKDDFWKVENANSYVYWIPLTS